MMFSFRGADAVGSIGAQEIGARHFVDGLRPDEAALRHRVVRDASTSLAVLGLLSSGQFVERAAGYGCWWAHKRGKCARGGC